MHSKAPRPASLKLAKVGGDTRRYGKDAMVLTQFEPSKGFINPLCWQMLVLDGDNTIQHKAKQGKGGRHLKKCRKMDKIKAVI